MNVVQHAIVCHKYIQRKKYWAVYMKPLKDFYNLLELDKCYVYQLFFTESLL
jgi:hypothetical protein